MEDLRRVAERSQATLVEVFRLLKVLDAGLLAFVPLSDYSKIGDLPDFGKIVVTGDRANGHRIVVRDVRGGFEVSEVIAVEYRTGDLPYLLAGLRLGRLEDPVRRSDAQRRVARVQRLRDG